MRRMNIQIKMFNPEKTFDMTDQIKEEEKLRIIAQIKEQVLKNKNSIVQCNVIITVKTI